MHENLNFQKNEPYKKDSFDFDELLKKASTTKSINITTLSNKDDENSQDEALKGDLGVLKKEEEEAYSSEYEIDKNEELEEQFIEEVKTSTYKNKDIQDIDDKLKKVGYIPNTQILYTLKNAMLLDKPILIEGEPGVGKTSLAYAYAKAYGLDVIKVQFYSGITSSDILYEYDYAKQMLYMNAIRENINMELKGLSANEALHKLSLNGVNFFGKEFLIERPILKSISGDRRCVLLLDEIDKSDEEVEYMLLEILDTYSITIPEYGTVKCKEGAKPIVFLTSNRYRDLSQAMKRRCLYLYIEPKTIDETTEIITKNANVSPDFAANVAKKVIDIRKLNLKQNPSISDAINWAVALLENMGINAFDDDNIEQTLGVLLKNKSDITTVIRSKIL